MQGTTGFQKAELYQFCRQARAKIEAGALGDALDLVRETIMGCPDAPEPHNILGIIRAREGNRTLAMRHFRAAWALDPAYEPAKHNLEQLGASAPAEPRFDYGEG